MPAHGEGAARAQIERGGLAMDERINQELTLNIRQASA